MSTQLTVIRLVEMMRAARDGNPVKFGARPSSKNWRRAPHPARFAVAPDEYGWPRATDTSLEAKAYSRLPVRRTRG